MSVSQLSHTTKVADVALHMEQTQPVGGLLSGETGLEEDEFWRFRSEDAGGPELGARWRLLGRCGFGVTTTEPLLVFKVMVPTPCGEDAGDT